MEYEMEELITIVGRLAEKYNAHESTSMTYEKAEQLMEAILYCIHETEQFGDSFMVSITLCSFFCVVDRTQGLTYPRLGKL